MAGEQPCRIQERSESCRLLRAMCILLVKSNFYRYVTLMRIWMLADTRTDRRRFPERDGPDQGTGGSSSVDEPNGRGWHDECDYHHVQAPHTASGSLGRTMVDRELHGSSTQAIADPCSENSAGPVLTPDRPSCSDILSTHPPMYQRCRAQAALLATFEFSRVNERDKSRRPNIAGGGSVSEHRDQCGCHRHSTS